MTEWRSAATMESANLDHSNTEPAFLQRRGELYLSGRALEELLEAVTCRGVPFRFCARGRSMAPFIRDGDIITVSPIESRLPTVGDVVAFVRPGSHKLIIHRVVDRQAEGWLIRGDACSISEGPIALDHLLGQVTRVERGGRQVLLGLGPERRLIPWLLRHRQLFSVLRAARRYARRILRRGTE